jgi:hypothetical protein
MLPMALSVVLLTGCRPAPPGSGAATRDAEAHLLEEEPPGARGVLEIKEDLASRDAPDQWTSVVLVARIGGIDGQTWDPNRAAFVAMDLSSIEEASQHAATEHDSNQCPFCQAKKKKLLESTALVEIVDANGEVPSVDAQTLLGLEQGQDIVVRGEARVDRLGGLAVRAAGIYLRPSSPEAGS